MFGLLFEESETGVCRKGAGARAEQGGAHPGGITPSFPRAASAEAIPLGLSGAPALQVFPWDV